MVNHPLRMYDYLTLARQNLLAQIRPLTPEEYGREFAIGPGTIGRTLTHVMICEWFYIERLQGHTVPPYAEWPIQDEHPPPFDALEANWTRQARETRRVLEQERDWDATIEFPAIDIGEGDPRITITATNADLVTQLVLHEVHHRAQVLNMLRQLGAPAPDLDFNTLMFTRRPSG
ncbi:MAG: DinB family protein [Phycisphaerales bacterium]